LGDIAQVIAGIKISGGSQEAPAAMLILGADVPEDLKNKDLSSLTTIQGVAGSYALEKEVWVTLNDRGGVKLSQVKAALAAAKILIHDRR
jgi:hypothetical protein